MNRPPAFVAATAALIVGALACTGEEGGRPRAPDASADGSGGSGGAPAAAGGASPSSGGAAAAGGGPTGGVGGALEAGASDCERIEAACAAVDPGTGAIHDCRELGASGDGDACRAELESCTAVCGARLCTRLGGLCHPVDHGTGPTHECHDLGHAGVVATCFARGAECNALCIAALQDSGPGPDPHGDAGDAGRDASDDGGGPRPIFDSGVPEGGAPLCDYIGRACSEIDPGTGPIHECALLAASADAGACEARLDGCRALCGASLCVRMGNVCHDPGTTGGGILEDCHDLGHAGDAGPCFDDAVECLALCRAAG